LRNNVTTRSTKKFDNQHCIQRNRAGRNGVTLLTTFRNN